MTQAWTRWGGDAEFITDSARAGECGVCIFRRGHTGLDNCLVEFIKPFFDRYGSEANVFEFDGETGSFLRVNPRWIATYYPA